MTWRRVASTEGSRGKTDAETTKWCLKSQTLAHRATENETEAGIGTDLRNADDAPGHDRQRHVSVDIAGTGARTVVHDANPDPERLFVFTFVCKTMRGLFNPYIGIRTTHIPMYVSLSCLVQHFPICRSAARQLDSCGTYKSIV